jgi:hypothetical protein
MIRLMGLWVGVERGEQMMRAEADGVGVGVDVGFAAARRFFSSAEARE